MRFFVVSIIFCITIFSCTRSDEGKVSLPDSAPARPIAVLKAGEYPLWFQFGAQGPELLNSIDEACFSRALIPWPLAIHSRFMLARNDDVLLALNGDGFLVFSPLDGSKAGEPETALYHFSGGDYWKPYTVAAFMFCGDTPAALLYRDDRFLDTGAALPLPRTWTFNMKTSVPFPLDIPALHAFPASEGWDVDTLRYSSEAYWYYRAIKKDGAEKSIKFMRTRTLEDDSEETSLGLFYNSAQPEPLSGAPPALAFLIKTIGSTGTVMAVSPDFSIQRYFAHNDNSPVNTLAYVRTDPVAALAIDVHGHGLASPAAAAASAAPDTQAEKPRALELPSLPQNFAYTGIALSGRTIVAVWEEQEEYNIGAAGFMVLRLP